MLGKISYINTIQKKDKINQILINSMIIARTITNSIILSNIYAKSNKNVSTIREMFWRLFK